MKIETTQNSKTIILCGRGKCCPKIAKQNGPKEEYITISDDYNKEVKLTIEETKQLKEAITEPLD